MPMIVAASICGPGDHVFLPHRFRVLSGLCDRICVLLDRCPEAEAICRRFPKVEVRYFDSPAMPMAHDGPCWREGMARQIVWDWAVDCNPQYVILGDVDEIPSPAITGMIVEGMPDDFDCLYADWVNLIHDAGHAIGGERSVWSYQNKGTNKKGLIVRYVKGREYRYRTNATRHVRLEPSPLHESRTLYDGAHRLGPVPLIHYKWANWDRWRTSESANLAAYTPWPPADAEIVAVPRSHLWRWDADLFIERLPKRVAVVGNGPIVSRGREIDDHAAVIRFNNWRTEGYEPHVGSKTTVWCCNCWDDVAMREWTGDMLTVNTDHEQPDRNSRWLGVYPHLHVPRVSWVEQTRDIKSEHPSTGLTLMAQLVKAGKIVDAYGFDGMQTGHYWDAAHAHDHPGEVNELAAMAGRGVRFR